MGPAPEPHSLTHLKSSGDFMRYLGEMLGQELVWSSFLRRGGGGHGQYVLNVHRAVLGREDRNGPRDHFLFGTVPDQEKREGKI